MLPDPTVPLSREGARECVERWFHTPPPPQELADFLTKWRDRGETPTELAGVVDAVMAHHVPIHLPPMMLDCCGTGGSGHHRFNASTVSAMVLASMGVSVAKHGNRGSRLANGSMDFLDSLGMDLLMPVDSLQQMASEFLVAFLFARRFHPLLGNMAAARALMTGRSVFNLIGPLCNPAYPRYQIIGCPTHSIASLLAATMAMDPNRMGWVVVGGDGRDDFSLTHPSHIIQVGHGRISSVEPPPILGQHHPPIWGDATHNSRAFQAWAWDPSSAPSITEQVVLPVAAGLMITHTETSWFRAIELARGAIINGGFTSWYQRFKNAWGLYGSDNGGLE